MIDLDFTFEAELWGATGNWVLVTLPVEMSEDIKHFTRHMTKGFRSVRVKVCVGETEWKTSIFPGKNQGAYVMPVKKAIRTAENLVVGETASFSISVAI